MNRPAVPVVFIFWMLSLLFVHSSEVTVPQIGTQTSNLNTGISALSSLGDGATLSWQIQSGDVLQVSAYTLGIGFKWFYVTEGDGTVIDGSYASTKTTFGSNFGISGNFVMPVNQNFYIACWLDSDNDGIVDASDDYGWAKLRYDGTDIVPLDSLITNHAVKIPGGEYQGISYAHGIDFLGNLNSNAGVLGASAGANGTSIRWEILSGSVLQPTSATAGIGFKWYHVPEGRGTYIDSNFASNRTVFGTNFGSVTTSNITMPLNESFYMACWLDDDEDDIADSDGSDRYGWAEFIYDGSEITLVRSSMSDHGILVRSGNRPVIDPIGSRSLYEGDSMNLNISGSDPDGDGILFSAISIPSFATLTDNNNGTATIALSPTTDDVGTHTFQIGITDDSPSGIAGLQTEFTVTVNGLGFLTWKHTHFSNAEIAAGSADYDADLDGDGLTNAFEYLYKTDPKIHDSGSNRFKVIAMVYGGGAYGQFTYTRSTTVNVNHIELQYSFDLINWRSMDGTGLSSSHYSYEESTKNNGDGTETVTIISRINDFRPTHTYYRLKINL